MFGALPLARWPTVGESERPIHPTLWMMNFVTVIKPL